MYFSLKNSLQWINLVIEANVTRHQRRIQESIMGGGLGTKPQKTSAPRLPGSRKCEETPFLNIVFHFWTNLENIF